MKIIGSIDLSLFKDENGEIEDTTYLGGCIVMLSEKEIKLLAALQDAWDGKIFKWELDYRDIKEIEMSNTFKAIRSFIEAKFAINEFKVTINHLDSILVKEKDELQS